MSHQGVRRWNQKESLLLKDGIGPTSPYKKRGSNRKLRPWKYVGYNIDMPAAVNSVENKREGDSKKGGNTNVHGSDHKYKGMIVDPLPT